MFPGESPGRSRLDLLGRWSAEIASSGMADRSLVTIVNHFITVSEYERRQKGVCGLFSMMSKNTQYDGQP